MASGTGGRPAANRPRGSSQQKSEPQSPSLRSPPNQSVNNLPPSSPLPAVISPERDSTSSIPGAALPAADVSDSSISLSTTPKQSHILTGIQHSDPRPTGLAATSHSVRTAPSTLSSAHHGTNRDSTGWMTDDALTQAGGGGTIGRGYPSAPSVRKPRAISSDC